MKMKYNLYNLLLCLIVAVTACNSKEDPIFSQRSHERVEAKIKLYKDALISQEDGWKMTYYLKDRRFSFLMKFSADGRVTMASSFTDNQTLESSWRITAEESIVLSFDSYTFLHNLADPSYSPQGKGFEGDFEFLFDESIQSDKIGMVGRKHKQQQELTKATAQDWENMLNPSEEQKKIQKMLFGENAPIHRALVNENGDIVATILLEPGKQTALIYYYNDQGEFVLKNKLYVDYYSDGFGFDKEVLFNGQAISKFVFTETTEEDQQVFVVEGTDLKMVKSNESVAYPNAYDAFSVSRSIYFVTNMGTVVQQIFNDFKEEIPTMATLGYAWDLLPDKGSFLIGEFYGGSYRFYHITTKRATLLGENNRGDQISFAAEGMAGSTSITDEDYDALLATSSIWTLFQLLNWEGNGAHLIPIDDGKGFYWVNNLDPQVWFYFEKE